MKKVFAMLLAVLLLSSMACGQKAGTVETQETAAPVATEIPKAEVEAVRQVGAYDVVANDGAKAGTEAYPYMVKTKYSVWYLASADIEMQGEDAFFAGLAEVLQYFDEDVADAQKALAGLVKHPNAGGVLVLGLGCENNNIPEFKKILGQYDPERVRFLVSQDVEDEIEEGLRIVRELCDIASRDERENTTSDRLIVGLKCGGSDGLSGITANPVVGAFSDLLIGGGGTAILTEVPEMFGAETLLMKRCVSREIFDKTVDLINGFKEYFIRYGQTVYENPSPGNKAGGITTLEDKSLGCTQKCGSAPVMDVIGYGDPVTAPGLNLLSAPGNDLVASTSLAVSGAQIVLFTTGRGTPFGSPVPTVKISSNSALAEKKKDWIDFDAGTVCDTGDIRGRGRELFDYVMALASGEIRTKNEENGMRGISIFKDGVTL